MTRSPQEPTARADRAVLTRLEAEAAAFCIELAQADAEASFDDPKVEAAAERALTKLTALVPAAATERLVSIEQVSDALNSELDDTEGGNDLVAAVLERLARSEGSGAEPAAMSLLDRDTYNRLAGSAEPDDGGGAL